MSYPGDWTCAKCGAPNESYRYTCRNCGASAR